MPNFWILDERELWHEAACKAARAHGFNARRVSRGDQVTDGVGFIRPHADWRKLPRNQRDYATMAERLTMIQDADQVNLYEDKSGQFAKWGEWMPDTWRFTNLEDAMTFAESADYPVVSKADVGSSSLNIRILKNKAEAQNHINQLFGAGISVKHGANCPETTQQGYALLQRFVPHEITYRANVIGDCFAVFFRYCYADKPIAQTGNVEPAMQLTEEMESLLEYADRFAKHAGTKWCALDILKDGDQWKLLETSLAWPWPSQGKLNEAPIFGSGKTWDRLFDVMFDELRRGAWSVA